MSRFNHYAKLKRILDAEEPGWYIRRIDEKTSAKNFKGKLIYFDHYYRLYHADGSQIRYGKFQQLDRLAQALDVAPENLPVTE